MGNEDTATFRGQIDAYLSQFEGSKFVYLNGPDSVEI